MSKRRLFRKRSSPYHEQDYDEQQEQYKQPKTITLDGKIQEPDHDKPKTIWEKLSEERLYPQLREMGNSYESIDAFQKRRVLKSILFGLVIMFLAVFLHPWFYVAIPMVVFAAYKMQIRKVDSYYKAWRFARQLNFSKFTRLVIPYLKASGGNMALYTIFNRILQRLENDADKRSLYRLMGEMSDNPADIQPFLDYAERSSGTDMSHLFMSTIFDFQQTTFNTNVIDELGKIAAEDMMASIDEIIEMKIRRFVMFPTKMVMTSFILVVGLGAGLLFHNLKDIQIDGGGLSFIESEITDEDHSKEEVKADEVIEEAENTGDQQTSGIMDKIKGLISKDDLPIEVKESSEDGEFIVDIPDNILFDYDEAELRSDATKILDSVIILLKELDDGTTVLINGHTDSTGNESYNLDLSDKRADSVYRYISAKGELGNLTFETKGYGQSEPIASNDTAEGRQKNRRVEFVIRQD